MAKVELRQYLFDLLKDAGLRHVHYSGENIHCQCPFHLPRNNTSAFGVSFVDRSAKYDSVDEIYPYNCLSCGAKGNVIKLIAHIQECSMKKALKRFQKSVITLPVTVHSLKAQIEQVLTRTRPTDRQSRGIVPPRVKSSSKTLKYLEKRSRLAHGVLDVNYIMGTYKPYFCDEGQWAGRIIMPIKDEMGEIVEFNDRTIGKGTKSRHRPGSRINNLLYGLFEATGKKTVVIVEGAFDLFQVASVCRREFKNTGVVALMGITFPETRREAVIANFDQALVMLDNKGEKDTYRAAEKIRFSLGMEMKAWNITKEYHMGKDPGMCMEEEIVEALKKRPKEKTRLDELRRQLDAGN